MSETTTMKKGLSSVVGVLMIFTLTQATFVLTPALSLLSEKYPDLPYSTITYLSTIPNLIGIPMGIIAGALIKKGMKYKTLLVMSIILMVIGGALPYAIANFGGWLAARCLFGVGFGIVVPMSGTMVMRVFAGNQATSVQGYGSAIQNLMGIILQLVSGFVCTINVDLMWLVHLIFIIPMIIFIICTPEPEKEVPGNNASSTEAAKSKTPMPTAVFLMSAAYGLVFMFLYPYLLNMSAILSGEGIGGAGLAGTIASIYTVGGMIGGFLFPHMSKALKKWLIPVLCTVSAVAMFVGYTGHSSAQLIVGALLLGCSAMAIWPASVVYFGQIVPADNIAMANGIFSLCVNLFCFLASPFIALCASTMGVDPRNALLAGGMGLVAVTICYFIGSVKRTD